MREGEKRGKRMKREKRERRNEKQEKLNSTFFFFKIKKLHIARSLADLSSLFLSYRSLARSLISNSLSEREPSKLISPLE